MTLPSIAPNAPKHTASAPDLWTRSSGLNELTPTLRLAASWDFSSLDYERASDYIRMEIPGILNWSIAGYNQLYSDQNERSSTT